jgi:Dolichyl-phosphate-mannose-protein mannosyltransferase
MELVLFHFTGVSLIAARLLVLGIFAVNLLLAYLVLRTQVSRPTALFGVTLLVSNAFLYAFSRLAILEQPLMLFLLGSWLLALCLPRLTNATARITAQIAVGLLLCLAVLTKTTALFLIPSTLFLVWHAYGYKFSESFKPLLTVTLAGILTFGLYYGIFVWPRYAYDYHYLFAVNVWDQPNSLPGYLAAFWYALHGVLWIDPWLCGLALALLVMSTVFARSLWRNPLLIAPLLVCAGYIFFIGWHNNMQPRYYQVIAYPLVFVITLVLATLLRLPRPSVGANGLARPLAFAAVAAAAFISAVNFREIIYWTRYPEYTWIDAARRITDYIDRHPYRNRLLLSISGDNITLITHLPAICDDFGTWDLPKRIHNYQPGWYAAWNELDPGTLEDLHTQYSLERVATFQAFDDPDRNLLILYKLHPLPHARQEYDQAIEAQANKGK